MKPFLVVGSAHLDVLANATHRDDVLDRIGTVSIEVGGTACNIAINLAHAGAPVRFLTAMNGSAYSHVIVEYLESMKIEPRIQLEVDLPTAAFSAHLDTTGELVSAVSAMPVEKVEFDPARCAAAMDGCQAVVLDCNLSESTLSKITHLANSRHIPVYVAAVSEEKAIRIRHLRNQVAAVFLNRKELRALSRALLGKSAPVLDIARWLESPLLVTDGARGSTVALPNGRRTRIPPCNINHQGTRLGMGDALVAGVVLGHQVRGLPLSDAALAALSLVAKVGNCSHCHQGQHGALEAAIDRFQHNAGHDALTGCLNRYSIERHIGRAIDLISRNQQHALSTLMVDIDHFKKINDTYGHNEGDKALVRVTGAITSCLRGTDALGRWGGEEFLVVLPGASLLDAEKVAERIREAVQNTVRTPQPITVSIGCAQYVTNPPDSKDSLLSRADQALYAAKAGGRNRVCLPINHRERDLIRA